MSKTINKDEFVSYYVTHSMPEICAKFDISRTKAWQIATSIGLKKKRGTTKIKLV